MVRLVAMVFMSLLCLLPRPVGAETYPTKLIELVVPYAPGGSSDFIARIIAPYLKEELGVPIVIQNRPGANTAIGAAQVGRASTDGYTLLLADVALLLNSAIRGRAVGYDPIADFNPIAMVGAAPFVLFAPAGGSSTLAEFLARSKGRGMNIANSGSGSLGHLGAELLRQKTNANIVSVPYNGAGPAMNDTFGGQVDAIFGSTASGMAFVNNGQLRALAVAAPHRILDVSDMPTFAELGVEGMDVLNWWGVVAPAQLDDAKAQLLGEAVRKVVDRPEVRRRLSDLLVTASSSSGADFQQVIKSGMTLWGDVVQKSHLKIE